MREYISLEEPIYEPIETFCFVKYNKSYPPLTTHIHPQQFEICIHESGHQIYTVGGVDYETQGGSLFITLPNEKHSTGLYCEEISSFYYLIFTIETESFLQFTERETAYLKERFYGSVERQYAATPRLMRLLNHIKAVNKSAHPLKSARLLALMTQLFCELAVCLDRAWKPADTDMGQIKAWIDGHPERNVCVEDLARRAHLSVSRFHQKFKELTGMPVMKYAVQQKIEAAKKQLAAKRRSITEIALELGFSSSQHFASVFKKYTTMTPSEYQKRQ